MSIYRPTWLMIKQHNQTGLKYFCKTVRKDPYQYKGSGIYWTRHLKEHGTDITTLWCQQFTDRDLLIEYALKFSVENNIVESTEWANLIPENGVDGGGNCGLVIGPHSDEHKKKISESVRAKAADMTRKPHVMTEEQRQKQKQNMVGKCDWSEERKQAAKDSWTDERRKAWSESKIGKPHSKKHRQPPKITCPHCNKSIYPPAFAQWHGEQCKYKP